MIELGPGADVVSASREQYGGSHTLLLRSNGPFLMEATCSN